MTQGCRRSGTPSARRRPADVRPDTARAVRGDTGLSDAAHDALCGQLLAAASYNRGDARRPRQRLDPARRGRRRCPSGRRRQVGPKDSTCSSWPSTGSACRGCSAITAPPSTSRGWSTRSGSSRRSAEPGTGMTPPWHCMARGRPQATFQRCWPPNATLRRRSGSGHGRSCLPADLISPNSHTLPVMRESAGRVGVL